MAADRILGGRYELIEHLGQGGMGSVWRARRLTTLAEVAVKLIDPALVVSNEAIGRFRREAQAAEAIRSTHVVQILDYDVDDGTPFIVMELLKGEDLATRLKRSCTLTPGETALLLGQVAKAIALAHEQDIVHRDLKPENIFIVREADDEVVKVLDFGIARHHAGLGDSSGIRTRTGMVLGTPYYMSPEQASGQAVNHLTDIWSFAVIAFECMTGRHAFEGSSFLELGTAICRDAMPVPSQRGSVPAGFDAWFAQAASRAKSARFQSIRVAADALRTVCGPHSAQATATVDLIASVDAVVHDARWAASAPPPDTRNVSTRTVDLAPQSTVSPASRSLADAPEPKPRYTWLVIAAATVVAVVGTLLGINRLDRSLPQRAAVASAAFVASARTSSAPAADAPPQAIDTPQAALTPVAASPLPRDLEAAAIRESAALSKRQHQAPPIGKSQSSPVANAAAPVPSTAAQPTASAAPRPHAPSLFGGID